MEILQSKWFIAILLPLALLATASFLSKKSVHTELVIPATPAEIWAILMDTPSYTSWNPVLVKVDGAFQEGARLSNHVQEPGGSLTVMTSTVRKLDVEKEINQFGGVPGVLTFSHTYLLEPVEGGTRVTQHEVYRGIGVWFWDESWVEPAYASANKALASRIAALNSATTPNN